MENYMCFSRLKKIISFLLSLFIVYLFISYYVYGIGYVILFFPIALGVYHNILQSSSKKEFIFGVCSVLVYASSVFLLNVLFLSIDSIYFRVNNLNENSLSKFGRELLISSFFSALYILVIIFIKQKLVKFEDNLFPKCNFIFSRLVTILFCLFFILPFLINFLICAIVIYNLRVNDGFYSYIEIFVFFIFILFVMYALSGMMQLVLNLKYSKNKKENIIGVILFILHIILLNFVILYVYKVSDDSIHKFYSIIYEKYFYHLIFINLSPLLLGLLLRYSVKCLENIEQNKIQ